MITSCTRCGVALDCPISHEESDQEGNLWRTYCDRCNDAFNEAMRAEFPFGQCRRCGCKYDKYERPCDRCYGLGEVPEVDGVGVVWMACGPCGGTGEVEEIDGPHEETICGLREPWYVVHGTPTREEVLGWTIEAQAVRERDLAYTAATGDIPF